MAPTSPVNNTLCATSGAHSGPGVSVHLMCQLLKSSWQQGSPQSSRRPQPYCTGIDTRGAANTGPSAGEAALA
jgi:hypothetical protein